MRDYTEIEKQILREERKEAVKVSINPFARAIGKLQILSVVFW